MRLPRTRFTVRTLLMLVAVAAVAMTTAWPAMDRRWTACRIAADRHWAAAGSKSTVAAYYERNGFKDMAALSRRSEALHRDLARRMTWAFFDPTRDCLADDDLY